MAKPKGKRPPGPDPGVDLVATQRALRAWLARYKKLASLEDALESPAATARELAEAIRPATTEGEIEAERIATVDKAYERVTKLLEASELHAAVDRLVVALSQIADPVERATHSTLEVERLARKRGFVDFADPVFRLWPSDDDSHWANDETVDFDPKTIANLRSFVDIAREFITAVVAAEQTLSQWRRVPIFRANGKKLQLQHFLVLLNKAGFEPDEIAGLIIDDTKKRKTKRETKRKGSPRALRADRYGATLRDLKGSDNSTRELSGKSTRKN